MKTKEITKLLKKNLKPIIIAVTVIFVAVVAWAIVKKIFGNKDDKGKVKDLTGDEPTPTINFDDLSLRLINAFNGALSMFTDEEAVYGCLKELKKQADWEYLKLKYNRTFRDLGYLEQGVHIVAGGFGGTLVSDMSRELSKKELQKCREILEESDINPGF